ncbi:hypothetical protein [Rugosimonospora africana]|uniref:Uncharacterized protein n=1 Tax=Rugosimonospora africana TaxID=556532 RepID=A0A8J3QSV8_9ACTN|nr:hypothetical protein [Rugosimonospora africana]GIH16248.1 hypothetical protein Raf01_44200 [Rugosimonospora africana]
MPASTTAKHAPRRVLRAARLVWGCVSGRIAIMSVIIGAVELSTHYWTTLPLVALLPWQVRHARRGGGR